MVYILISIEGAGKQNNIPVSKSVIEIGFIIASKNNIQIK
jgi:hypothetical protein